MDTLIVYTTRTTMDKTLVSLDQLMNDSVESLGELGPVREPEGMLEMEEEAQRRAARVADIQTMRVILLAHGDKHLRQNAAEEFRERRQTQGKGWHMRGYGWSRVTIRLRGGSYLQMETPYLRPKRKGGPGRARKSGNRGKGGSGGYPVLEKLGIVDGVTPALRSEIALQTVLCGSYEEAIEQLKRSGVSVDEDALIRVSVGTGAKALELRDGVLREAMREERPEASLVAGRRVRCSLDGGKAQLRFTHWRGRKKDNGRNGFDLEWREPRLMTVEVLDGEGRPDPSWQSIYEVVLGEADEVFEVMTGLLRLIGVREAKELIFVADGAKWIWNRVEQMLEHTGIPRERVRLVLDFYHACERIGKALKACKNLSTTARNKKFAELRKLLKRGEVDEVVEHLRKLARGRRGRKVREHIDYLVRHAKHMDYGALQERKIPIGSGVVESAIRRVINLRFKAPGTAWRPDRLMPLMYLRAILKAGRWNEFIRNWLQGEHWLTPGSPTSVLEVPPCAQAA